MKEYCTYTLDNYLIMYEPHIQVEKFSCDTYYGISFKIKDGHWDIVHNRYLGNRLIICPHQFWCQDVPFKKETFGLLPTGIEVLTI